jgi:hypothetical protein
MRTVDCRYTISDERLRAYAKVPLIDRLRWLDELVRFTQMWREAPRVEAPNRRPSDRPPTSP